jgi:hypothetical protein
MLKHIPHEPCLLAHEQLAFMTRHDARSVLSAMLQDGECVVDLLIDGRVTNDSNDSAHER